MKHKANYFYLFCDVPPKYIPKLNKNTLNKKPKVSLKKLKLSKCLFFVNLLYILLFMLHKMMAVWTVCKIPVATGTERSVRRFVVNTNL